MGIFSKGEPGGNHGWTVDSGMLSFEGTPRIDLATVTRARCQLLSRGYVIVLRSEDSKASIGFRRDEKAFKRTGGEILLALQQSAPQVRVHMRGGPSDVGLGFFCGLAALAGAFWVLSIAAFGDPKFGWEALPFVLFLVAAGAGFTWLNYPWNANRFYATPKQAAKAIKQVGWRAYYRRYG